MATNSAFQRFNPASIAPPFGAYVQGVAVPEGARWLHTAGQVGVAADGSVPESFEAQTEQVWENIKAILAGADMGLEDLVKITAYVVGPEHFKTYAEVRKRVLGDVRPASTAIVVPALVFPEWLIEVEAVAAKA